MPPLCYSYVFYCISNRPNRSRSNNNNPNPLAAMQAKPPPLQPLQPAAAAAAAATLHRAACRRTSRRRRNLVATRNSALLAVRRRNFPPPPTGSGAHRRLICPPIRPPLDQALDQARERQARGRPCLRTKVQPLLNLVVELGGGGGGAERPEATCRRTNPRLLGAVRRGLREQAARKGRISPRTSHRAQPLPAPLAPARDGRVARPPGLICRPTNRRARLRPVPLLMVTPRGRSRFRITGVFFFFPC